MYTIFPKSPLAKTIDPDFQEEAQAAKNSDFTPAYIDLDLLQSGDVDAATQTITKSQTETITKALYRGWMLRTEQYQAFSENLNEKNIHLLTQPEDYEHLHHLPNTLEIFQNASPQTIISKRPENLESANSFEKIHHDLAIFGTKPIIVKDYVKSRKWDWENACYIRAANDRQEVERVTRNFLIGQGSLFTGGLVYREWLPLEKATPSSDVYEYRAFIFQQRIISLAPRTTENITDKPCLSDFHENIQRISSPFFTVDFAKVIDRNWIVLEVGDGGVSEIPKSVNVQEFYRMIANIMMSDLIKSKK
jgi:hypothetical protein